MTAPLFLRDDLTADEIELSGTEGHHAATVRRVRAGERVDLADGRGTRARCTVLAVEHDRVRLRVDAREVEPEPRPRLVLVQALAKGDRGELAVELATEVGVDEVVPWQAERCIVRWDGPRGERALGRWRSTAREAGKQSRRARHPVVAHWASTEELLARVATTTSLVLHEDATEPLASVPLPEQGDLLLVVGPEGGVTDRELAALTAAGATAVRLGQQRAAHLHRRRRGGVGRQRPDGTVGVRAAAGLVALAVLLAPGTAWGQEEPTPEPSPTSDGELPVPLPVPSPEPTSPEPAPEPTEEPVEPEPTRGPARTPPPAAARPTVEPSPEPVEEASVAPSPSPVATATPSARPSAAATVAAEPEADDGSTSTIGRLLTEAVALGLMLGVAGLAGLVWTRERT